MGETTSNRKEHKQSVDQAQGATRRPESGKKGGELASPGHGPATRKNEEHRGHGGQDESKKKSD